MFIKKYKKTLLFMFSFLICFYPTFSLTKNIKLNFENEEELIHDIKNDKIKRIIIPNNNEYINHSNGKINFSKINSINSINSIESYEVSYKSNDMQLTNWLDVGSIGGLISVFMPPPLGAIFFLGSRFVCVPVNTTKIAYDDKKMTISNSLVKTEYKYDKKNMTVFETFEELITSVGIFGSILTTIINTIKNNKFPEKISIIFLVMTLLLGSMELIKDGIIDGQKGNQDIHGIPMWDIKNKFNNDAKSPSSMQNASLLFGCPYFWIKNKTSSYSSYIREINQDDWRFYFYKNEVLDYSIVNYLTLNVTGIFNEVNLESVDWNRLPIEEDIWKSNIFLPYHNTTYQDIENLIIDSINTHKLIMSDGRETELIEDEFEIIFLDSNDKVTGNRIMKEELVNTRDINFYIKATNSSSNPVFFNETEVNSLAIPYFDMTLDSLYGINNYLNMPMMDWQKANEVTRDGSSNQINKFITNDAVSFTTKDTNISKIEVDNPFDINGKKHIQHIRTRSNL